MDGRWLVAAVLDDAILSFLLDIYFLKKNGSFLALWNLLIASLGT